MLHVEFINSLSDVASDEWNNIAGLDYPFTRYEFLYALEVSGATSAKTGWEVSHALLFKDKELVGLMPLYIKQHSYGEYVFDFEWANAYSRNGLSYYPKLVSAIPFTPACGPRLCLLSSVDEQEACTLLFSEIKHFSLKKGLSGWHLLFSEKGLNKRFEELGALSRLAVQFHWHNDNFENFDAFLASFNSRKRKNLRKERLRVAEQGVKLKTYNGEQITPDIWSHFFRFYQMTYAKRSGHGGYLNHTFFKIIGEALSDHIVLVMAEYEGRWIAGALNFKDSKNLYGRYWGCIEEFDSLHFEACYYQGIEYCINNKLDRFDPGAQGEHKIQRGFRPTFTYSNHWLVHSEFFNAVGHFLREEAVSIKHYHQDAETYLPFKQ